MSALCSSSKIDKLSEGVSSQTSGLLWGQGLERGTGGFWGLVTQRVHVVESPQATCRWCVSTCSVWLIPQEQVFMARRTVVTKTHLRCLNEIP